MWLLAGNTDFLFCFKNSQMFSGGITLQHSEGTREIPRDWEACLLGAWDSLGRQHGEWAVPRGRGAHPEAF